MNNLFKGKTQDGTWVFGELERISEDLTCIKPCNDGKKLIPILQGTARSLVAIYQYKDNSINYFDRDIIINTKTGELGIILHGLYSHVNDVGTILGEQCGYHIKWQETGKETSCYGLKEPDNTIALWGNLLDHRELMVGKAYYDHKAPTGYTTASGNLIHVGDILCYSEDKEYNPYNKYIYYEVTMCKGKLVLRDCTEWYKETKQETVHPDIPLYAWISREPNYYKPDVLHKKELMFTRYGYSLSVICNDKVYHEDFFDMEETEDEFGVSAKKITLSQITKQLKEKGICNNDIILAMYENSLEGEIYQWGNYHKGIEWYEKGKTVGR